MFMVKVLVLVICWVILKVESGVDKVVWFFFVRVVDVVLGVEISFGVG